jgi:hypothetical protein
MTAWVGSTERGTTDRVVVRSRNLACSTDGWRLSIFMKEEDDDEGNGQRLSGKVANKVVNMDDWSLVEAQHRSASGSWTGACTVRREPPPEPECGFPRVSGRNLPAQSLQMGELLRCGYKVLWISEHPVPFDGHPDGHTSRSVGMGGISKGKFV